MNQVMISADSTCDLPVDLQRQRHVYCFALSILLGDTAYADGVEIRPADIYADVAENHRLPKTAAVPPGVYYDKFKQWTDAGCSVVHIGLSSAISSSYQNACTAAADLDNIVGMQRERPTLIHKQEYRLAAIALERDRQGAVRRENVRGKAHIVGADGCQSQDLGHRLHHRAAGGE